MSAWGRLAPVLCAALALGCQSQPPSLPAPAASETHAFEVDPAARRASTPYRVDPSRSDVRILVYRAGRFPGLGHNHVITARNLTGRVYLHPQLTRSSFDLSIPVEDLVVDDPAARGEEGEAFSAEIAAADVEATRGNLLGARVLEVENFPLVELSGNLVEAGGSLQASFVLQVKGRHVALTAPLTLDPAGETLIVSGSFTLTHAALGLEPFSLLLGVVQVAEEFALKFSIVARREASIVSRK